MRATKKFSRPLKCIRNFSLLTTLYFAFCGTVSAQEGFHITVGINACDVTGDPYWTFQKPGLLAGGGTYATMFKREKVHYRFGLYFAQKGSRKPPDPKNSDPNEYNLRLNYVEAPLQFDFDLKPGVHALVGSSLGYLLNYSEKDQSGREMNAPVKFKKIEWAGWAGGGVSLGASWKLEFGYSYSLFRIRSNLTLANWYYSRGAHNSLFFMKLTKLILKKSENINNVDEN